MTHLTQIHGGLFHFADRHESAISVFVQQVRLVHFELSHPNRQVLALTDLQVLVRLILWRCARLDSV